MEKEQYELMRRIEDDHWWYVGMRHIVAGMLTPCTKSAGNWRVLDAGCGTGATLDFFANLGTVVGLDIADAALQHCLERGHRNLTFGSIERLPFDANSFDLVSSFDVIYHRAVRDDLAAVQEFYRVLRPGGRLIIRVPAYDWLRGAHDRAVHTRHRYTRRELTAKLSSAGFSVVRVTHANCFLLPLAIAKRVAESRGAGLSGDLSRPPAVTNGTLAALLKLEAKIIRRNDLPFGLSVIALGVKDCAKDDGFSGSQSS